MGVLSMNPDHDRASRPRLAHEIAEKEEWNEPQEEITQNQAELGELKSPKPIEKMKLGGFEFDMTYPRTLPGIVRIVQILAMLLGFICLLIMSAWPDQGTFAFFCVFLVFGMIISGYLLFTLLANLRGDVCCGFSWVTLELIYFIGFGLTIFLASCLSANLATEASLTIAAIFGFLATITYVYCAWDTWKLRKALLKKAEEEEEEKETKEEEEGGQDEENPKTPTPIKKDDFEIEREIKMEGKRKNNSLPTKLKEKLYENQQEFTDSQRRRHYSGSDKDSAYSEGTITPTKGKVAPTKMRRTTSAYDIDREFHHVLHKQPLTHLTHRPYGGRTDHEGRRNRNSHSRRRAGHGLVNMGYDHDDSRFGDKDLRRSLKRQKSMPDWLRAALGTEVEANDNILDDESEVVLPTVRKNSTFPALSPKEFPLLHHSDQESINYPSVSQNGPGRQFYTLPHKQGEFADRVELGQQRSRRHHHGKRRRDHHHHGRRLHHHHRHHHHHKRIVPHRHNVHHRENGRRPITDAHEDYLRRMVENDELVAKDGPAGKSLHGFHNHQGKPINKGKRQMIPEDPIAIHFPEQSRWDEEQLHQDNHSPMMEKYLADTQKIRQKQPVSIRDHL